MLATPRVLRVCALVAAAVGGMFASPAMADEPGEAEQVRREFDEILSQPEFRRLRRASVKSAEDDATTPGWLRRFVDWLADWFDRRQSVTSGLGALWPILAYSALAATSCLIIWLIVRAVNNYRRLPNEDEVRRPAAEEGETAAPPGDLPADEYQRRAEAFAARGEYLAAVGQLILGTMSRIERRGLIRHRRGLTHRDYLRALRGHPGPQQAFRTQVAVYEPICFGRRPAGEEHYRAVFEAYRTGFGELAELAGMRNAS